MILLSVTMFILGVLAFSDALFNYGNIFRMLFSALLILMSVWAYLKTRDLNDLERSEIIKTREQIKPNTDDVELVQNIENTKKKPEKVNV